MTVSRLASPFRGIGRAAVMVCTLVLATVGRAATITEIATAPVTVAATTWPVFVEVYLGADAGPADLLILDGRVGMERRIVRRVRLGGGPAELVVVHEGTWPVQPAAHVQVIGVETLGLTAVASGPWAGTSRWLMVTDPVGPDWPAETGWAPQPPQQWTGIHDAVGFYDGAAWSLDRSLGPVSLELAAGMGAVRHRSAEGQWLERFSTGLPDGLGCLPDGNALTPGMVNRLFTPAWDQQAVAQPEPAAWCGLSLGLTATLLRRRAAGRSVRPSAHRKAP